jgi:hypothetical protein
MRWRHRPERLFAWVHMGPFSLRLAKGWKMNDLPG